MSNLGKKLTMLALSGAVAAFSLVGCQDLDVDNPNAPDRTRALAEPGDIVSLISSSYEAYHGSSQYYWPGMALSVGADHHTAPWGNFAMLDFGSEPRTEWNNNNTYAYAFTTEFSWFDLYGAIVSASNGLRAMNEDIEVPNEARVRAFAKFVQGLSHGFIALIFDQGYIVDETTDPGATQSFQPYTAVMDAALSYLDAAIQISESNDFTIPEGWMANANMDSDALARLAHSYKARFMASVPRSPAEAQSVDWAAVASEVDQGIQQDFAHTSDGSDAFWSGIKPLGAAWVDIWARVDYKQAGPADVSGEWENWVNTPVADRNMFVIETPDQRFPDTAEDGARGLYFNFNSSIAYPPSRGTYHFSHYGDHRYEDYAFSCTFCWFGTYVEMTVTEMRLLKAEALMMQGDMAGGAELINVTRTANGGLPPVTADGVPEGEECVPQETDLTAINSGDAPCGDLWDALFYEKGLEVFQVSAGIPFFDDRRWGLLPSGTPVHWPVPGQELETLQMEIYTYGGGGESSAPSIVAGDKESILRRISYDLEMMEKMRQRAEEQRAALSIDGR